MAATVKQVGDVPPADLGQDDDMRGVELLPLITEADGAAHFSMRLLRVAPDGYTPFHAHPWEHEVYVVRGSGELVMESERVAIRTATVVHVPAGERHRFQAGKDGMDFICCIPHPEEG